MLAEPDFRSRPNRGQVRVEFTGLSAKAIAKEGVLNGDVLSLSLEGVDWVNDGRSDRRSTTDLEWELKFTNRLVVQVGRWQSYDNHSDWPWQKLERLPD